MDYLVCPDDGVQVKVVEAPSEVQGRPRVRCPECLKDYVYTSDGTLDEVEPD